jgi:hypothetical protein
MHRVEKLVDIWEYYEQVPTSDKAEELLIMAEDLESVHLDK